MERLSLATWWLGDALLVCLLLRACGQRLFPRYPFFYGYILAVTIADGIRQYFYMTNPSSFQIAWWISEFVTAIIGFGVTWEIFSQVLLPYPGVRRMSRAILLALLGSVLIRSAVAWRGTSLRALIPTTNELEQNLRVLQALLLIGMVGLIVYYALPMGRNVGSMLWGYGSYLVVHVLLLTLRTEWGNSFDHILLLLPALSYCVTLVVWCVGMWSFQASPESSLALQHDYDRLARQASRALDRLRDHLIESWRA